MSFIIIGRNKRTGKLSVLDTSDLVVEDASDSEVDFVAKKGYECLNLKKNTIPFGVAQEGCSYEVYLHGYDNPLYQGSFPDVCERGLLYNHYITMLGCGRVCSHLCILLRCECWCRFGIELPLIMYHVLKLPIRNLQDCRLCCSTQTPIFLTDDEHLKNQIERCNGDFPYKWCVPTGLALRFTVDGYLDVLGCNFGTNLPDGFNLCRNIKYLNLL